MTDYQTKRTIVVFGQTPPPFGGQALMIRYLLEIDDPGLNFVHIPMTFSSELGRSGRVDAGKILGMLRLLFAIVRAKVEHPKVQAMYFPPSGATRTSLYRDIIILLLSRRLFRKTIFHFHASGLGASYRHRSLAERMLIRAAYFGPSAAIRISLLAPDEPSFCRAKKAFIVPNGVPDTVLPCSPKRCATDGGDFTILFVGIVGEAKGAIRLLDAVSLLKRHDLRPNVRLVGDVDYKLGDHGLRAAIHERGLEQQVTVSGVLTGEEKDAAFASADVMCFPTLFEHETFPLVLLEAQAHSLPVVASDWRAVPGIVDHGISGFLAKDGDASETAQYLRRLIQDGGLRHSMAEQARASYERRFRVEVFQDAIKSVLLEVLAES